MFCKCGCGMQITRKRKGVGYLRGHNLRVDNPMSHESTRQKMSASSRGKIPWNKGKFGVQISWLKNRKMPVWLRERFSDIHSRAYANGYRQSAYQSHWGEYWSEKNKCYIKYRSSWELIAFEILENLSKVSCYVYEPFRIPYKDGDGLVRYTIPDIQVYWEDGTEELIEIKPEWFAYREREQCRVERMEDYAKGNGMKFSLWTEQNLGLPRDRRYDHK